jgi:hypothetical protein
MVHGLTGKQVGNREAVAAIKRSAQERAEILKGIVAEMQDHGYNGVRVMAVELNNRGILTPRGGKWHATCPQASREAT